MSPAFKLRNAALVMALSAIYPLHGHAATTGIAQFAVGDVSVRRGAVVAPLNRGQQIQSGDSVVTGRAGQTQLRFSDGGLVSLAPNSQFTIDRYADENAPQDGFFASFLRGGMRAITGLVGKRNRDNYKITAATATIGIRGSAFSANYNPDGSLNVAGEQDGIVVCTNAGCVELIVGEAVTVTSSDVLPRRTAERSNVPPLVARQDLFVPENPAVIQLVQLPQSTLVNGVLNGVSAMFAFGDGNGPIDTYPRGGEDPSNGVGTFVDGQLVRHEGSVGFIDLEAAAQEMPVSLSEIVEKTSSGPGSFGTVGSADDPGFVGWGYWDAGRIDYGQEGAQASIEEAGQGVHYIVGRPTPQAQMPVTGTASYSLLGGTAPTAYDSEASLLRVGTLDSAGLNVDFGVGRLNGFVNTTFNGPDGPVAVQISGYGYVEGSTFYASEYGSGYYYGDSGYFYGFFTGNGASRAAMVYRGYDDAVGTVDGAAVFLKSGTGQAFTEQSGMSAMFVAPDDYVFDYYPRGDIDPSVGTGYFVGNQMYLHDDGANGYGGYYEDEYYDYGGSGVMASTSPVTSSGSIGNAGDADFIGWGYWAKATENGESTLRGVHYIVGRPTPSNQMPSTGVATYSMVGGTAPTATDGSGTSITGRLLGATMNVDFAQSSASATINTDFVKNGATIPVTIQEGMYVNGAWLCGNNINGFFVGNQATRAGLIYRKDTDSSLGVVSGAVGLARGAIAPSPD